MKRKKEMNSLKDLIPEMLQEKKLEKGMHQIRVQEVWAEVMGNGVANYTDSVRLQNGILLVRLSSSALREELEYGKEKIIKMLNESLNILLIKSIKFI